MSVTGLSVCALVPVKERWLAKSRLRGVLSPFQRMLLQDAMLADVMEALAASTELSRVAICSPDGQHARVAERCGAQFIAQPEEISGLNAATAYAAATLARQGADLIAVLPGDLPQLDTIEVDAAIRAAMASGGTIVIPDRHGQGTNGLIFRADAAPEFRYGAGSFRRHLAADHAMQTTPMLLRSFATDIDTPDDLDAFLDMDASAMPRYSGYVVRGLLADIPNTELKLGGQTS